MRCDSSVSIHQGPYQSPVIRQEWHLLNRPISLAPSFSIWPIKICFSGNLPICSAGGYLEWPSWRHTCPTTIIPIVHQPSTSLRGQIQPLPSQQPQSEEEEEDPRVTSPAENYLYIWFSELR